jgi:undecaprenyl-diphosphatase
MIDSLITADIHLFWLLNSAHTPLLDLFFATVTWLGSGWVAGSVLALLVALRIPRSKLRRTVIMCVVAMLASGLLNRGLKELFQRPRPLTYFARNPAAALSAAEEATDARDLEVHVVGAALRYRSFPSGHTNTAFSAAILMIMLFGGWYWLALIPAALVGYSRIYLGVHFPLDVLGGALLAAMVVPATVLLFRKRYAADEEETALDT